MQTENLNEMIQQVSSNPVDLNDPDYIYTLPRKKLTYDDVKNDAVNAEKQTTEPTIPQVEVPKKTGAVKLPDNNYQPGSEEALIRYTMSIHKKVQTYSIGGYWEIGRTINSFYQGKYGTKELERISKAIGIGRDTLNKMCKFAKQYSRDQVESLLSGAFPVYWLQISQNLSVEPDKMIRVYQETGDPEQFHNRIMKLKDPQESRGKSKSASIVVSEDVTEPSITNAATENPVLNETPPEKVATITVIQDPNDHMKEIDALQAENKKLREDLEHRKCQVNKFEELYYDAVSTVSEKTELIEKLRTTLKKVHDMVENRSDHASILSRIDWRILE